MSLLLIEYYIHQYYVCLDQIVMLRSIYWYIIIIGIVFLLWVHVIIQCSNTERPNYPTNTAKLLPQYKTLNLKNETQNEQFYNKQYFDWQSKLNVFGGVYKADLLNHIINQFRTITPISSVLELGSSGGHIINAIQADRKIGVEINDIARQYHVTHFHKTESYKLIEHVPTPKIDLIYSSSVIEHVDSPLLTLRQLLSIVNTNGILIVTIRNDGINKNEWRWPGTSSSRQNNHIYTWNAALLGNLITNAGWVVCDVISEFSSWHGDHYKDYTRDKWKYCKDGLVIGKKRNVQTVYALAVAPTHDTNTAKNRCKQIQPLFVNSLNCEWAKIARQHNNMTKLV